VLVVFATIPIHAQDPATMLARVPDSANVVATIDVNGLMQSDLGTREGWAQKRNMDYLAGVVPFPPSMKFVVSACAFNPVNHNSDWQIALATFANPVDPYVIAKKEGSEVEWIDEQFVIPSRRNAYFLQLDRFNYGVYTPANRQHFSKWVSFVKATKNSTDTKISPYLVNTVQAGAAFGQVSIVMDLANFLNKTEVQKRLAQSKAVEEAKPDVTALANFITGIKGLRLSIKADSAFTAELRFDFSESAQPYQGIFAPLLNEVVTKTGVPLGDMTSWKMQISGNSVTLRGGLHTDEVRRIVALVTPLGPNSDVDDNLSGSQAILVTSQRYYRALQTLLNDLRKKSDQLDKARDWNNNAAWYEYAAGKIDQLPTVDTDPDLVKMGDDVAGKLRVMAQSLRGVNIQNKVLDSQQYTNQGWGGWGGYYGGYGGGRYSDSNWREVASAKVQQAADGAKDRNAIWVTIKNAMTDLQSALAKKYGAEF
jgi:hypothetical protein